MDRASSLHFWILMGSGLSTEIVMKSAFTSTFTRVHIKLDLAFLHINKGEASLQYSEWLLISYSRSNQPQIWSITTEIMCTAGIIITYIIQFSGLGNNMRKRRKRGRMLQNKAFTLPLSFMIFQMRNPDTVIL